MRYSLCITLVTAVILPLPSVSAMVIAVHGRDTPIITTSAIRAGSASLKDAQGRGRAVRLNNRGIMKMRAGGLVELMGAKEDFDNAIAADTSYGPAWMQRGIIEAKLNRHDRAVRYYNRALKIDPSNARAYLSRGIAHYRTAKTADALSDYTLAIRHDPELSEAYEKRGLLLAKMGKYEASIKDNSKAIELNPENPVPYNNRAGALQRLGRKDEALKDIAKANALSRAAE